MNSTIENCAEQTEKGFKLHAFIGNDNKSSFEVAVKGWSAHTRTTMTMKMHSNDKCWRDEKLTDWLNEWVGERMIGQWLAKSVMDKYLDRQDVQKRESNDLPNEKPFVNIEVIRK